MSSFHHPSHAKAAIGGSPSSWASAQSRFLPVAYSLTLIGLGIAACIFPFAGTVVAGYDLGWTFVAGGVSSVVAGIGHWRERGHWLDLILGLVTCVFGCSFLMLPLAGAALILWSLSLWFALGGVMKITAAVHFPEGRAVMIFVGLVDLVLSASLLVAFATFDLALVSLLAGFSFIMNGVATFVRGAGSPSPEAGLI